MSAPLVSGLYLITPDGWPLSRLLTATEQALAAGARIVQYRDKLATPAQMHRTASALNNLTRSCGATFIVNDDPVLAREVGAHGVHLGADDMRPAEARLILGQDAIIGVSCYNRLDQGQQAGENGADYVAFGAFYSSRTKPQAQRADVALLTRARATIACPIVAIGGIHAGNAEGLIDAGADALAVIDAVYAADDVPLAVRCLTALYSRRVDA